jgi:hypothetical protein
VGHQDGRCNQIDDIRPDNWVGSGPFQGHKRFKQTGVIDQYQGLYRCRIHKAKEQIQPGWQDGRIGQIGLHVDAPALNRIGRRRERQGEIAPIGNGLHQAEAQTSRGTGNNIGIHAGPLRYGTAIGVNGTIAEGDPQGQAMQGLHHRWSWLFLDVFLVCSRPESVPLTRMVN